MLLKKELFSKSFSAVPFGIFRNFIRITLLLSLFLTSFNVELQASTSSSNVLLLGVTLNDLSFEDAQRFSKHNVLERAFTSGDNVKDLVKQSRPIAVIIKQPSGGIYEYSPDGSLIKQLSQKSEMKKVMEMQRTSNLPTEIQNQGFTHRATNLPRSNAPPFMGQQFPNMPMRYPTTPPPMRPCTVCRPIGSSPLKKMPMFGPYDIKHSYRSASVPIAMAPMMIPNSQPSSIQQPAYNPQTPQNRQVLTSFNQQRHSPLNNRPNLVPPPSFSTRTMNAPFPGAEIPSNVFPGKSEYSYLPGEGDNDPPQGIAQSRQVLKQLAGLAQNNAYPFWFDNFLQTDANATQFLGNNVGGAAVGTNAGFPTLNFTADTTANAAVVGSQWTQTGVGIGSLLIDSFLEGREIQARRAARRADAAGSAYYYYPNNANTYYPSTPYQPIPNRNWY
ncbi:MAG: hypothetical protein QNJ31_04655 [Candidatus Caenarcaniphilales bacterium]|nr:hypothetical protein [Candidatus Caenarcaniphilales bacterium]